MSKARAETGHDGALRQMAREMRNLKAELDAVLIALHGGHRTTVSGVLVPFEECRREPCFSVRRALADHRAGRGEEA